MVSSSFVPPLLTKEYILDAISREDSVSLESQSDSCVLVWDEQDTKELTFHFLEKMSPDALTDKIHISKDIPQNYQIDKTALSHYLWNSVDKNAFITLDEVVILWSEPEDPDTFEPSDFTDSERRRLYVQFLDDYAYEIGDGVLGQEWFERNIVIINMGEIVRCSRQVAEENKDLADPWFSFENQVITAFLTTVIHELRHLQLDTNIFLPESIYPQELASEEEVEEYCRSTYEKSSVDPMFIPGLFEQTPALTQGKPIPIITSPCSGSSTRHSLDEQIESVLARKESLQTHTKTNPHLARKESSHEI